MLGQQAEHEAGFLQRIRHVVAVVQQLHQRAPLRLVLGQLARVHHQLVGVALPGLGARGQALGGGGIALQPVRQRVAQALRQGVAVGGVFFQQVVVAAAAAQAARQLGLGLVEQQRRRVGVVGGVDEHAGQKVARLGLAQHLVQPVTQAELAGALRGHGVPDQALGAGVQPRHVAGAGTRAGLQHRHRAFAADEVQQALARAVPVDQEHDALADAFELLRQFGFIVRLEARGAHVIGVALVQALGGALLGLAPVRAHLGQQALEEGEALAVQVGIGQRDDLRRGGGVDLDHQHVRVVGADVVLDQQLVAVARGGRVEAGVVELERRGAVQPAHEGGDARAVAVVARQLPAVRAVDAVGGQPGRQAIERLVQVHHHDVQAVAARALAMGQRLDLRGGQHRAGQCIQLGLPVRHALGECSVGTVAFDQRARHHTQVVGQAQRQARQIGHAQGAIGFAGGGSGQVVQPVGLGAHGDVGGGDLARQIQCRLARVVGMGVRGLQHAQVELQAVVGLERGAHLRRPQQRGQRRRLLAQRGDGIAFFHG